MKTETESVIEEVMKQHFKIQDDYTFSNVKDAMNNLTERIKRQVEDYGLPSGKQIQDWAYKVIPITDEGCVENDIDFAKRSLLIKGALWATEQICKKLKQ